MGGGSRVYPRGAQHFRWRDGSYIHSSGYVMVNVGKTHPLSDSKGYCPLHVLVWVSAGNERARMKDGLLVHHVNHIKHDNRFENLALAEWTNHTIAHNRAARGDEGLPDEGDPVLAGDDIPYEATPCTAD